MSAKNTILSSIQKKDASQSALVSAFDNANEVAAKLEKQEKDKKQKDK